MSERSFAVCCVGMALVFAMVVPEPGSVDAGPAAGVAVAQPPAPVEQQRVLAPMQAGPFAVSQVSPGKVRSAPVLLWAAHSAP